MVDGPGCELISVEQMYAADRMTIEAGTLGIDLMESAGAAVAAAVLAFDPNAPVTVLCGPGNNGGDGFVAARLLMQGQQSDGNCDHLRLFLLGDVQDLKGDAAEAARRWAEAGGKTQPLTGDAIAEGDIVVDALFGAGLKRSLSGVPAELADTAKERAAFVVAVDVPSGIDGNSGQAEGPSFTADRTVTFFRKKPGHCLYPGKEKCGQTSCADIGISSTVLSKIGPKTYENDVPLWRHVMPVRAASTHKYSYGHALIVSGGPDQTGAARMSATAALRVGAGLVTIATPLAAASVHAAHETAIMVRSFADSHELGGILQDGRKNAIVIGPGAGVGEYTQDLVLEVLSAGRAAVLDADALTSFEADATTLFAALNEMCVLTPHGGEFARLFPDIVSTDASRLDQVRAAAEQSGAIVVLKGPDTLIAAPDGRVAINGNAPPCLATAGSGDVLAGLIGGLLAQGMPAWEAACAAVWVHGECGREGGRGLVATDLPRYLPQILKNMDLFVD